VGTRNAPSLLDVGAYRTYFWDGRAASLEEQVQGPLLNPTEMGLASDAALIQRVLENAAYRESFRTLNGRDSIEAKDVARAIVAYERTLGRKPTALERFLDGDHTALASAAQRGLRLFTGKAGCVSCHKIEGSSRPLTDNLYHTSSLGLRAMGPRIGALIEKLSAQSAAQRTLCIQENPECAALGRFAISLDPKDVGAFRTPSLRAVSHTAPYMHDGSVETLEEALDLELYYLGANRGYPVILSDDERQDLLVFLRQL
jgi:cytochrome c peroxidase